MKTQHETPGRSEARAIALTIAGFDPSSGAGITADLLTFAAHGIFATSAITALTVQSTTGVRGVHAVAASQLADTLACLEDDLPPMGIKIGMLADADHVNIVADYLGEARRRRPVHVVLDPVLRSSSGAVLLSDRGADRMKSRLMPLVDVSTPNLREAEVLTGKPCRNRAEMERCAANLQESYAGLSVVLTGGHLAEPSDLFWDSEGSAWFDGDHIATRATHGTGCAFSTALLANRLAGRGWRESVPLAKDFVRRAMLSAEPLGKGRGPMNLIRPAAQ